MSTIEHIQTSPQHKFIQSILNGLSEMYREYGEEVETSKVLYEAGAKNELVTRLESYLNDPLVQLNDLSIRVKEIAFDLINEVVKVFCKREQENFEAVLRTKSNIKNSLHYCFVLKHDTPANRNRVLSFLNSYERRDFSKEFPVYIQFLPKDLSEKIAYAERLI